MGRDSGMVATASNENDQADPPLETVGQQLQGRLSRRFLDQGVDFPQRRSCRGRDDEAFPAAISDECAAEGNVRLVGIADVDCEGFDVFGRGERLAGQHRLIQLETVGFDEPKIGGDPLTALQQHEIPWNDITPRDDQFPVVTQYSAGRCGHRFECLDIGFRLALLNEAQRRVDREDQEDGPGVDPVPLHERDQCRDQQDGDQRASKLAQKHAPPRS
jgi:hypothetical protein